MAVLFFAGSRLRFWEPSPSADLLHAGASLVILAALVAGSRRLARAASHRQRRQLEDDVTTTQAEVRSSRLPLHVALAGPGKRELDEYRRRRAEAENRLKRAKERLGRHHRAGRSARIRHRWTFVFAGFGAGLFAMPWAVWLGKFDPVSAPIAVGALADVTGALILARCLAGFWRERAWPSEPEPAPNARSLSPGLLLFAAPFLLVAAWHSEPAGSTGEALAGAARPLGALAMSVAMWKLFGSAAIARFEDAWERAAEPWQRRLARLATGCARSAGVALALVATVLLALAVAFARCDAEVAANSLTVAYLAGLCAMCLGDAGRLRFDSDGGMIRSSALHDLIRDHPLGPGGLTAMIGAYAVVLTVVGSWI